MSRAFIKEDAGDDELPDRAQPSGPNYVTPCGLDRLRKKAGAAPSRSEPTQEQRRDLRYWQARVGSAVLVDNSKKPPEDIRFGATVDAKDGRGALRRFHIVGQDEAQEGGEKISWDSVQARALLGLRIGERARWAEEASELDLIIVAIRYS